jgi:RNA polymerase sigma factor (TIGR02999 family)
MSESITLLLEAAKTGDATATQRLFASVYAELKLLARAHRRRWQGNETINTTALIHEAFIKLSGSEGYANRTHFYATASKAMRQILVNYAEQQRTEKRGGDRVQVPRRTHDAVVSWNAVCSGACRSRKPRTRSISRPPP